MKKIIKRNAAKCLNCNQTLDVTDLLPNIVLVCNCHSVHISGGNVEHRLVGSNMSFAKSLAEYIEVQEPKKHPKE